MAITYPTLREQNVQRDFIEVFGGYNHNLRISEGEFYDMKNLTSSHYPLLSTREPRGTVADYRISIGGVNAFTVFKPVGMCDNNGLNVLLSTPSPLKEDENGQPLYVLLLLKKGKIYFAGYTYITPGRNRQMVSMGANVVVFPDTKYFNVTEISEKKDINDPSFTDWETFEENNVSKDMEVRYKSSGDVTFKLCKADGTGYEIDKTSSDEPKENVKNGFIWLDTSVTPPSLKQYSEASKMWASIASVYIKISATGIGKDFEVYDSVKISGITEKSLKSLNTTTIIQAKGDDYIVVIGILDNAAGYTQTDAIEVKRLVPYMDFVCESGNRIWGCRYGKNIYGKTVNEIYASKLGDFKNWESFQGTSTDSYIASVGADGEFTGAVSYLGRPMFFKQNCLYTVYGNYPASYQIQLTECRGVQNGCHNSLVVIDGTLYYKALGGVCAYNGSLPVEIGEALGEQGRKYYEAWAGEYRHKYYIGLNETEDKSNATYLFVYDTEKKMWHKEDEYNGREFCYCSSNNVDGLYYIANGRVESVIGQPWHDKLEENIDWFAETGVLGCSSPDKKYISKISIRFSVDLGTRIRVFAEYDSSGSWEQLAVFTGTRLGAFTLPFKPRRCDHLRLRIEGNGAAKIYSISKTMEDGGEF